MRLAALVAAAALAGTTSHHAARAHNAFVLLGDGRIVKLDVSRGRVVARRPLGKTPRRLPDHGPDAHRRRIARVRARSDSTADARRHRPRAPRQGTVRSAARRAIPRCRARAATYAFGYREGRVIDPVAGL